MYDSTLYWFLIIVEDDVFELSRENLVCVVVVLLYAVVDNFEQRGLILDTVYHMFFPMFIVVKPNTVRSETNIC